MRRAVLFLLPILLVSGCASSANWGWYVIDPTKPAGLTNVQFLLGGFWATILISITAAVISASLGLLVALPGLSEKRGWRIVNRVYVEFVRAIPLLPMLFWVFYGLPLVFKSMGLDIPIDPFWDAVIREQKQPIKSHP